MRIGTLVCVAAALSGCSSAERIVETTQRIVETTKPKESTYSRRVVEEGEAVPKGGGRYKLGKPYVQNGRTYVPSEDPNYRAEGLASWYGPDFHGRETANGEVFNMQSISAAHPTLPMPSYVRVTNLSNDRSIIVRVNDRGPYVSNRIIDLSIGAAKALDFHSKGVARVRVEYVGRANLEGSDDKMLLATLRQGSPAPVPSQIRMLASAKPLSPVPSSPTLASASSKPVDLKTADAKTTDAKTHVATVRPSSTRETASRTARAQAVPPTGPDRKKSLVKLPDGPVAPPPISSTASTGFSARGAEGLGFVSGRGLY